MNQPLQNLKGFRDYLPQEKRARDFVAGKIKEVFQKFGFEPLETPTLEYADLLLGKYGAEADRLVYTFEDKGGRQVGLRYDQTVPTARVLSQYRNELPRYFRRYQTGNVYRAEKPQKGRYREFTQWDIDIFGSVDPLADAEILAATYEAFKNTGFPTVNLVLNDRRSLVAALEPLATEAVTVYSIIQSVDKLDKLPADEVKAELTGKGLDPQAADEMLNAVGRIEPTDELNRIMELATNLGVPRENLEYSPTLARGLDYYTGMIFEIKLPIEGFSVGSFGGGGRYDNLIEQLSGLNMPAVGVGLGFDRMVEAALWLKLVPENYRSTQVMVTVFDDLTIDASLSMATRLRQAGLRVEVYPNTNDPLGKQLQTAGQKQMPFVAIIGPDEAQNQTVTVKNMETGEQQNMLQVSVAEYIGNQIQAKRK
jgi:histidyl-tRNA synthetase